MMASKQDLSLNELLVLESELRDSQKSLVLCYVMLLGGHLGLPRFYLKRFSSAIMQLVLFILTMISYIGLVVGDITENFPITSGSLIGLIIFGLALTAWVIVDIILVPRMVKEWNEKLEQELIQQIIQYRGRGNS